MFKINIHQCPVDELRDKVRAFLPNSHLVLSRNDCIHLLQCNGIKYAHTPVPPSKRIDYIHHDIGTFCGKRETYSPLDIAPDDWPFGAVNPNIKSFVFDTYHNIARRNLTDNSIKCTTSTNCINMNEFFLHDNNLKDELVTSSQLLDDCSDLIVSETDRLRTLSESLSSNSPKISMTELEHQVPITELKDANLICDYDQSFIYYTKKQNIKYTTVYISNLRTVRAPVFTTPYIGLIELPLLTIDKGIIFFKRLHATVHFKKSNKSIHINRADGMTMPTSSLLDGTYGIDLYTEFQESFNGNVVIPYVHENISVSAIADIQTDTEYLKYLNGYHQICMFDVNVKIDTVCNCTLDLTLDTFTDEFYYVGIRLPSHITSSYTTIGTCSIIFDDVQFFESPYVELSGNDITIYFKLDDTFDLFRSERNMREIGVKFVIHFDFNLEETVNESTVVIQYKHDIRLTGLNVRVSNIILCDTVKQPRISNEYRITGNLIENRLYDPYIIPNISYNISINANTFDVYVSDMYDTLVTKVLKKTYNVIGHVYQNDMYGDPSIPSEIYMNDITIEEFHDFIKINIDEINTGFGYDNCMFKILSIHMKDTGLSNMKALIYRNLFGSGLGSEEYVNESPIYGHDSIILPPYIYDELVAHIPEPYVLRDVTFHINQYFE